jgi:cyclic pyranopterin phosphate synthase
MKKRNVRLSHIDRSGRACMVDVGEKPATVRTATAEAKVILGPILAQRIRAEGGLSKGPVIETARLAGIMAAKRTAELVPLCHPVALSHVDVKAVWEVDGVRLLAEARTVGPTGVEMEALTAASVAALTIYDMSKAASKEIVITGIRLLEKTGGRSGTYRAKP